jgi:predicted O-methyltransferase YrrM
LSVDPWQPDSQAVYRDIANVSADEYERFLGETRGRLAAFGARAQIWRLSGVDAASHIEAGSLDFVYLDARHDKESVACDLELWWPKVRVGGVLAGHDYLDGELPEGTFGVKSAVDSFFGTTGYRVHTTTDDQPWPSWIVLRTS